MTCIVGIVHKGHVIMGGDSAGVSGYDIVIRRDPKVFLRGELLMGFTTSFRMGQLLESKLKVPDLPRRNQGLREWMRGPFVDAVRTCLKDGGWATKQQEREAGGNFLVGVRGILFHIESDYQVGEPSGGYDACGCGYAYALGSLATSTGNPHERVRRALSAAAKFSAGVAPPFRILATPPRAA